MPTTMPVAVYVGARELAVESRPVPEPARGEVLVEVARCGICGSDLHLVLEGYARPGSVLGHEWSGRVVAVGAEAKRWRPGDRVVGRPAPGCGVCAACVRGRPSVCRARPPVDHFSFTGAYAQFVVVPAGRLTAVPDEIDDRAAALTEPLAVALHALTLAGLAPVRGGDASEALRVLVTGAGPVGLTVVALLADRGIREIVVSEPSPRRRARARAAGATRVVEPDALGAAPTGRTVAEPVDVVFECSGRAEAVAAGLDQLDRAGRLVLLGTGSERPRVNHNRMIVLELSVLGAYNYDASGFDDALALLASGRLPIDVLLDADEVGLDGLLDAMIACEQGRRPAKVLVDPRRAPDAQEDSR